MAVSSALGCRKPTTKQQQEEDPQPEKAVSAKTFRR
jgi:hypothetical protein